MKDEPTNWIVLEWSRKNDGEIPAVFVWKILSKVKPAVASEHCSMVVTLPGKMLCPTSNFNKCTRNMVYSSKTYHFSDEHPVNSQLITLSDVL